MASSPQGVGITPYLLVKTTTAGRSEEALSAVCSNNIDVQIILMLII